jgi:hypothetical protein
MNICQILLGKDKTGIVGSDGMIFERTLMYRKVVERCDLAG